MKEVRRVLVDFDQTLFQTIWPLYKYMGKYFDVKVSHDELAHYTSWEQRFGTTNKIIEEVEGLYYRSDEHLSLEIDQDAITFLRMLRQDTRYEWIIEILTARTKRHADATRQLLVNNNCLDVFDNVILAEELPHAQRNKVRDYAHLFKDAWAFIDDTVKLTIQAAQTYPNLHVFLLAGDLNKGDMHLVTEAENTHGFLLQLYTVSSWKEINDIAAPVLEMF